MTWLGKLIGGNTLLVFALIVPCGQAQPSAPRFEVGGHFTFISFPSAYPTSEKAGFGGTASWSLNHHLALDYASDFTFSSYPHSFAALANPNGGGRVHQEVAGIKVGWQKGRFGYYGRVRAGVFMANALVFTSLTPLQAAHEHIHPPELDLGRVFEARLSRHWVLRTDLGDPLVFTGNKCSPSMESR